VKKLFGILLVLALVLSFSVVATTPVAAATTYYVATTGNDGTGDGSTGAPWATIQYAISQAASGDTIVVEGGTYFGATVDKAVTIEAKTGDVVTINSGPLVISTWGRIGFYFADDYSGNGATIRGFNFGGTNQAGTIDDNLLDFAIFSRGAHDVTVENNVITDTLQAITNWHGDGWEIDGNVITNLWTLNGGGIGILVGTRYGATVTGNTITNNKISGTLSVYPADSGGYDGTGIVLYTDFRWGFPGGIVTGSLVEGNEISMVSDTPGVVNFSGIELTDTRGDDNNPAIYGNQVTYNSVKSNSRIGIYVSAGTTGNNINFNSIVGNPQHGVRYDGTGTLDATLNWWGHASGPSSVGLGTGDAVSANVDFEPWLMEEDGAETTATDTGSGATAFASTTSVSAQAAGGDGTTTVTVGEYAGNPSGASAGFRAGAVYVDVHVGGELPNELVVEIDCPGSCAGVVLQWWDGIEWKVVVVQEIDNGIVRATLNEVDSSPLLSELTGTPFGLGSLSTVGWEGSSVNKAAVVAPWIALLATMMAGASLLVLRRRRAQI